MLSTPLHPILVHFPIALFVVFALFDVSLFFILLFNSKKRRSFRRGDSKLAPASEILLLLSIAGAWAAVLSGLLLKAQKAKFLPHELLNTHELLGITFSSLITLLAIWRLRGRWRPSFGYTVVLVGCVGLLFFVGHTGGSMVWHPAGEAVSSKSVSASSSDKTTKSKKKKTSIKQSQKPKTNKTSSQTKNNTSSKSRDKTNTQSKSSSTSGSNTQQPQINQKEYTLGQTAFRKSCSQCHGLNVSKNRVGIYSKSQWNRVVQKMQNYANGSIPNTKAIVYYLSHLKK